jgi:hypothetical protein
LLGRLELEVLDPDVRSTQYYKPRFTRSPRAKVARRERIHMKAGRREGADSI